MKSVLRAIAVVVVALGAVASLAGTADAKPPWWTPPGGGEPPGEPVPTLDLVGTWNSDLADGLCYAITLPNNYDVGFDAGATIRDAITDWVAPVNDVATVRGLSLTDGSSGACDVEVAITLRRGGGRIQGTTSFASADGLITGAEIVVRGNFAGTPNGQDEVAVIARHEFGHALGLSHWNVSDLLMSPTLNATTTIHSCEANAVAAVQGWYFNGVGGPAAYPNSSYPCDPYA